MQGLRDGKFASFEKGIHYTEDLTALMHVEQLWIQEAVAAGELSVVKVPRAENCADALTHAWTAGDLVFWSQMGLRFSASTHQQQDSRSSTQGPVLQLLHLDVVAAGSQGSTSSTPTTTTTTMQGPQWQTGGCRAHTGGAPAKEEKSPGPRSGGTG